MRIVVGTQIVENRSTMTDCWYLRLLNLPIIWVRVSNIAGSRNEKFSRILYNNKMHLEKVKLCDGSFTISSDYWQQNWQRLF